MLIFYAFSVALLGACNSPHAISMVVCQLVGCLAQMLSVQLACCLARMVAHLACCLARLLVVHSSCYFVVLLY